jgi:hypothetical protein
MRLLWLAVALLAPALAVPGASAAAPLGPTSPVLLHEEGPSTIRPATLYRSAAGEYAVFAEIDSFTTSLRMWRLAPDGHAVAGAVDIPLPDDTRMADRHPSLLEDSITYNAARDEFAIAAATPDVGGAPRVLVQRVSGAGRTLGEPVELVAPASENRLATPLVHDPTSGGYLARWTGPSGVLRVVHLDAELRPDAPARVALPSASSAGDGGQISYDSRRRRFLVVRGDDFAVVAHTISPSGRPLGRVARFARSGPFEALHDVAYSRRSDRFVALTFRRAATTGRARLTARRLLPTGRPAGNPTRVDATRATSVEKDWGPARLVYAGRARQMAATWSRDDGDLRDGPVHHFLQRFDPAARHPTAPRFLLSDSNAVASVAYGARPNAYAMAWSSGTSGDATGRLYVDVLRAGR